MEINLKGKFAPLPSILLPGSSTAKTTSVPPSSNILHSQASINLVLNKSLKRKQEEDDSTGSSSLIGFKNSGNSCYLAAALQSILGYTFLVQEISNLTEGCANSEDVPIVGPLVEIISVLQSGQAQEANDLFRCVQQDLGKISEHFKGATMQDAMECLILIFNQMREYQASWFSGYLKKSNLTDSFLGCHMVEIFVCYSCGATKQRKLKENALYCNLPNDSSRMKSVPSSIQSLVSETFAAEIRERRCVACGGGLAMCTRKITILPKILLVCLKRFKFGGQGEHGLLEEKVEDPVDISEQLKLAEVMLENKGKDNGSRNHLYQLSSVVTHLGSSLNSGHYVADTKRLDKGGDWFHFDDEKVSGTSLEAVRMGKARFNGYIFSYAFQRT